MNTPTLYLLHGFIASGKTTYAKRLESEVNAIRFTADQWVVHFYGVNPDVKDFSICDDTVKTMIWSLAEKLLKKNVSVILDYGFWSRKDRDEYRSRAKELGVNCEIHTFLLEDEVALSRLLKRTSDLPNGELFIDENAYHVLRRKYQPLEKDEPHTLVSL